MRLTRYRIDEGRGNACALWKRMGSPIAPNAEQYTQLLAASQLARMEAPATLRIEKGQAALRFALPRQAVSWSCSSGRDSVALGSRRARSHVHAPLEIAVLVAVAIAISFSTGRRCRWQLR